MAGSRRVVLLRARHSENVCITNGVELQRENKSLAHSGRDNQEFGQEQGIGAKSRILSCSRTEREEAAMGREIEVWKQNLQDLASRLDDRD